MSLSLFPSLRASSSRLPLAPVMPLRRHFHASPPTSAVDIGTTVQSVDKALADLQKSSAQMRRSGRNLDITAMATPVIERTVEPPFRFSWLFRSKGRAYASQRFVRFRTTRKFLNDMIQKDLFPKRKGSNFLSSMVQGVLCLRPTHKAGLLMKDLENVYARFNEAQAAGDEVRIRALATGEALALSQKVAKAKRQMKWELVKSNAEPKLISARITPLDAEGRLELAQVVVRFDTDQALTTKGGQGSQTKQQRVVENCVFERHLPTKRGWRIKESLETSVPDV